MHPDMDAMIARMRKRGMIASLITNGYYLNQERIERLNRAGLDYLQISIDNVEPDAVSLKSLRLLEPKLKWLAEHARVRGQHQLRGGQRHREPRGRAGGGAPGARARLHEHDRDPARRPGPAARAGRARDEGLRGAEDVRQPGRRAGERAVPGQPRPRQAQRLELPRGLALPVRRRGRPRALLLADARRARHPPRGLHAAPTSSASTGRRRPALPTARSTACSGWPSSTTGGRRRPSNARLVARPARRAAGRAARRRLRRAAAAAGGA